MNPRPSSHFVWFVVPVLVLSYSFAPFAPLREPFLSKCLDDAADDGAKFTCRRCGDVEDVVGGGFAEGVGGAYVGDRGEAEDAHAGVGGDDRFGDGRHADGVAAEAAEHAVFGAGFVIRAEDGDVDAA